MYSDACGCRLVCRLVGGDVGGGRGGECTVTCVDVGW